MNLRARAATFVACAALICTSLIAAAAPAAAATAPAAPPGYFNPDNCEGVEGAFGNIASGVLGTTVAPILFRPELTAPRVEGDTVRAEGKVSFKSVGSCMAQVKFQLQSKVCGTWGCDWKERGSSDWKYLFRHADDGFVADDASMKCRSGTHSYRLRMSVVGPATITEEPRSNGKGAAIGVDPTASYGQSENGPVVKLTCP